MPELPEVETVVRGIKGALIGQQIKSLTLSGKNFRFPYPEDFELRIIGDKIVDVKRRAKYILIYLENDKCIVIHLGMSGKLLVGKNLVPAKHDHAIFEFHSCLQMKFNDPRRFGLITLLDSNLILKHSLFQNQGVEPLEKGFNSQYFYDLIQRRKIAIKLLLMDNKAIVGIGNIYASEILYKSLIHPMIPANVLNIVQCQSIVSNIKSVLLEAIDSGGSTLRDYVRSNGDIGYFQHKFMVYGKNKKPCINCGTLISKIIMGGRATFFCAQCQK